MRIYLDNIIYALQAAGGISIYWKELTKRILTTQNQTSFLEHYKSSNNIFRQELNIAEGQIIRDLPLPTRALRHLDPIIKVDDNSIFHSSYYRIIKHKHLCNIVTVHDFIHEFHRKGLPKIAHSYQKSRAINNAVGIICVSENTKTDLLNFYPSIPEDKVQVIYHGYGDEFMLLPLSYNKPKYLQTIEGKIVVYVGDRAAYKNFHLAVATLASLRNYHLLIIGGGRLSGKEQSLLHTKLGKRYSHIQGVTSKNLNEIYNFAHCLIYPSSYEGFGIPMLEAMAAGCPVIATRHSSIPEVSGDAAVLVGEAKVTLFMQAIRQLENHNFRETMIKRGFAQTKKFSWNKCFAETMAFYKKIASNN